MNDANPLRFLAVAGSLRDGSYNRALLRAARAVAPDEVEVRIAELHDIPLYNADVEQEGDPEPVRALKDALREADALVVATPEYNHGMPAVTKNVVDFSRSRGSAAPAPSRRPWPRRPTAASPGRSAG
jgi:chromate reductase, NAD(P)H dehydrogenase (quinone)